MTMTQTTQIIALTTVKVQHVRMAIFGSTKKPATTTTLMITIPVLTVCVQDVETIIRKLESKCVMMETISMMMVVGETVVDNLIVEMDTYGLALRIVMMEITLITMVVSIARFTLAEMDM